MVLSSIYQGPREIDIETKVSALASDTDYEKELAAERRLAPEHELYMAHDYY